MKKSKNPLIIFFTLMGVLCTSALLLYLFRNRLKACPFCKRFIKDEPEEEFVDDDILSEMEPVSAQPEEKEEKHSQNKIRRGYIPLKFHKESEKEEL